MNGQRCPWSAAGNTYATTRGPVGAYIPCAPTAAHQGGWGGIYKTSPLQGVIRALRTVPPHAYRQRVSPCAARRCGEHRTHCGEEEACDSVDHFCIFQHSLVRKARPPLRAGLLCTCNPRPLWRQRSFGQKGENPSQTNIVAGNSFAGGKQVHESRPLRSPGSIDSMLLRPHAEGSR